MDIDCPDCAVPMERVTFGMKKGLAESQAPFVRTADSREGLLGRLGLTDGQPVLTLLCPECGLLRQYADLDA
ncbi:hypothetical protein [Halorientalis salina]|uniref:hypothetical protein n=1 Tax=Halorientalis salina TaxID=2932266 RepID=UPI0010AD2564|nr:hypothetical protein [Halorientalis salina]